MNHSRKTEISGKPPYLPPQVIRVSLRPEEAVLGHCKVTGSAGPVSGSCHPMGVKCNSQGS